MILKRIISARFSWPFRYALHACLHVQHNTQDYQCEIQLTIQVWMHAGVCMYMYVCVCVYIYIYIERERERERERASPPYIYAYAYMHTYIRVKFKALPASLHIRTRTCMRSIHTYIHTINTYIHTGDDQGQGKSTACLSWFTYIHTYIHTYYTYRWCPRPRQEHCLPLLVSGRVQQSWPIPIGPHNPRILFSTLKAAKPILFILWVCVYVCICTTQEFYFRPWGLQSLYCLYCEYVCVYVYVSADDKCKKLSCCCVCGIILRTYRHACVHTYKHTCIHTRSVKRPSAARSLAAAVIYIHTCVHT